MQAAVEAPLEAPYCSGPQSAHTPHPDSENRPGGHDIPVALVDPPGHAYPAEQLPLQPGVERADDAPNRPAGQGVDTPATQ